MRGFEKAISAGTVVLGSIVLVLMMIQIVVDVALRQVLGAGFPATPDMVGKYYMVVLAVLPIAYTEVKRRHIEATIFTDQLRPSMRYWFALPGFVLAVAVFGLLTYAGTVEALRQSGKGAFIEAGLMRVLTWPSYWLLPLSFLIMTLLCVGRLWTVVTGKFELATHEPLEELQSGMEGDQ